MIRVREYRAADREQLRALAVDSYASLLPAGTTPQAGRAACDTYFNEVVAIPAGRGVILVAESGDRLVGFVCLLGPIQPDQQGTNDPPYAFMSDLFVVPERRRNGIGGQLAAEAEKYAREIGAGRIALKVLSDNRSALQFHQRNQYSERFVVMDKCL